MVTKDVTNALKLSSRKQTGIIRYSVGLEFKQGIAGTAGLCSTISGPQREGRTKGWSHLKMPSLTSWLGGAGLQLGPGFYRRPPFLWSCEGLTSQ